MSTAMKVATNFKANNATKSMNSAANRFHSGGIRNSVNVCGVGCGGGCCCCCCCGCWKAVGVPEAGGMPRGMKKELYVELKGVF